MNDHPDVDMSSESNPDPMERVAKPWLNPWVAIVLLFIALFGYIQLWKMILDG